jgi:Na+/proline symporter
MKLDYQHWLVIVSGVIAPFAPLVVAHLSASQLTTIGVVLGAIASTATTLLGLLKASPVLGSGK